MARTTKQLQTEVLSAVQRALSRTSNQFTAYAGGEWYAAPDVPGVRLRLDWHIEEAAASSQLSLFGAAVEADEEDE